MTIYNKGKRPFQGFYGGKDLLPGKFLEVPEKYGEAMLEAYPKELADTAPQGHKKKAAELKKKEAELKAREEALEKREAAQKKPATKKIAAKKKEDSQTPWDGDE